MKKTYITIFTEALESSSFNNEMSRDKNFVKPEITSPIEIKERFSCLYYGWMVAKGYTPKQ